MDYYGLCYQHHDRAYKDSYPHNMIYYYLFNKHVPALYPVCHHCTATVWSFGPQRLIFLGQALVRYCHFDVSLVNYSPVICYHGPHLLGSVGDGRATCINVQGNYFLIVPRVQGKWLGFKFGTIPQWDLRLCRVGLRAGL